MHRHTIHRREYHTGWNRTLPPARVIVSGDNVDLDCQEASGGQITPASTLDDLRYYDTARANPLSGPIHVDGAEPGDAIAVTVQALEGSGWGWTAILPGFGLLADDFPEQHLILSHHDADSIEFLPGIRLPYRPFIGTLGLAPAAAGTHSVIPPRRVGGNMDCRDLGIGTRLILPVEVPGALLSAGDTHAAQGDGEVCGTAVESPLRVQLQIELMKGQAPRFPWFEVPPGPLRSETGKGFLVTTGIGPDLMDAARDAVRGLIDQLAAHHKLSPEDAYCLVSVSGDLHISEIVDAPNWVVAAYFPLAVLD